jgi:DNA-binding NarL/FixJ family response regulator
MPLSVLIVDDHRIFREGVRNLLQESGDFQVVAEAGDVDQAIALAATHRPDVIILDLHLGDADGLSAIGPIRSRSPRSKVLVLSMNDDELVVSQALKLGARGFVLKTASSEDLRMALKAVVTGGVYLSDKVTQSMVQRVQPAGVRKRSMVAGLDALSPREFEVLELVADGKTSKEVADLLNLQVETVRTYRKTIMRKLGVNHVAGLVSVAMQSGLIRKPRRQ